MVTAAIYFNCKSFAIHLRKKTARPAGGTAGRREIYFISSI
jgi:hypothetical protein